jgi:hypothetical protein
MKGWKEVKEIENSGVGAVLGGVGPFRRRHAVMLVCCGLGRRA